MTESVCPNVNFVYFYDGTEGTNNIYEDPEDPTSTLILSLSNTDKHPMIQTESMSSSYEVSFYAKYTGGLNVSDTTQILTQIRSSEVPSNFDTFEFFMEDFNGRKATYACSDEKMGKTESILFTALVKDKGFNVTFVTKIGYHIKGCQSDITDFTAILTLLKFYSSPIPHYCQPQDVIDFLGMTTNDGVKFVLTDNTPLSYESVAGFIAGSEDYIEQMTRTYWNERRKTKEVKNLGSLSYMGRNTIPYIGMYQLPFSGMSSTMFKGIPVQLQYKNMKTLDATKGDKLEIRWFGNSWMDITPKNEEDSQDVWCDNAKSIIYLRRIVAQKDASVRVTYRYGLEEEVPETIKQCALMLTAKHILQNSQLYSFLLPESGEYEDRYMKYAVSLEYDAKNRLKAYADQTVIGGI